MNKRMMKLLGAVMAIVICLCAVSCGVPKLYENTGIPNFEAVTGASLVKTLGDEYIMYVYEVDAAERDAKIVQYLSKLEKDGFTVIGESETSASATAMIKGTDGLIVTAAGETTVTVMVCTAEVLTAGSDTAAAE